MAATATGVKELTTEELKAKIGSTSPADRPRLCIEIAERQLGSANRLYGAMESEKAQAALADVTTYSEMARDYAIQSRHRQKESEISIRIMVRKLADIKHVVTHEEQPPVQEAINRLERARDDLLAAMFKGAK